MKKKLFLSLMIILWIYSGAVHAQAVPKTMPKPNTGAPTTLPGQQTLLPEDKLMSGSLTIQTSLSKDTCRIWDITLNTGYIDQSSPHKPAVNKIGVSSTGIQALLPNSSTTVAMNTELLGTFTAGNFNGGGYLRIREIPYVRDFIFVKVTLSLVFAGAPTQNRVMTWVNVPLKKVATTLSFDKNFTAGIINAD
jgi:hypothetical protein